jgi:hypothetical protein
METLLETIDINYIEEDEEQADAREEQDEEDADASEEEDEDDEDEDKENK